MTTRKVTSELLLQLNFNVLEQFLRTNDLLGMPFRSVREMCPDKYLSPYFINIVSCLKAVEDILDGNGIYSGENVITDKVQAIGFADGSKASYFYDSKRRVIRIINQVRTPRLVVKEYPDDNTVIHRYYSSSTITKDIEPDFVTGQIYDDDGTLIESYSEHEGSPKNYLEHIYNDKGQIIKTKEKIIGSPGFPIRKNVWDYTYTKGTKDSELEVKNIFNGEYKGSVSIPCPPYN